MMNITSLLATPLDLYCERLGPEFWAEPFNALSNTFMLLAGAYFIPEQNKWVRLFAIIAILTGTGSFLFHTTAQVWSMLCDVIPIYLFILFYSYFSLTRIIQLPAYTSLVAVIGLMAINGFIEIFIPKEFLNGSAPYLPAFLMLMTIYVSAKRRDFLHSKQLGLALFIFGFSLIARTLDHAFCDLFPIGTHFVWHTLNGLLLFALMKTAQLTIQNKTPY